MTVNNPINIPTNTTVHNIEAILTITVLWEIIRKITIPKFQIIPRTTILQIIH